MNVLRYPTNRAEFLEELLSYIASSLYSFLFFLRYGRQMDTQRVKVHWRAIKLKEGTELYGIPSKTAFPQN